MSDPVESTLEDEAMAVLCRLRQRMPDRQSKRERHASAIAQIRQELTKLDHEFLAIVGWDDKDGEVEVRFEMLPGGKAELGDVLDEALDDALAQGLDWIGSLVLRKRSPMQVVGSDPVSLLCGIELDHGAWRFSESDGPKWIR